MIRDLQITRLRRDGSTVALSVSSGPIRDADGAVVGVVSLMSDIGERLRSEQALVASEARKDAILRSALDCVITIDGEGRIIEFNPAAEETFGWTRTEATGRAFLDLAVAPTHRPELAEVLESGRGALLGTRLEIDALRADRRAFPAELSLNRVDCDGPAVFTVSLRDVTQRKQREERLQEAEGKYRTLVEQLPFATYVNETGLPVRALHEPEDRGDARLPGRRMAGRRLLRERDPPHDFERVSAEVERTHTTGETFKAEYRMFAADGRVVWVQDETIAVRDEEYRPLFLQGFLLDVTGRRASEEALRQSEELHRLVVESSHDVIAMLDIDGTTRYISPSVAKVLGSSPDEFVGSRYGERIHPEDKIALQVHFKNALTGLPAPVMTARARHADGRWITLEGTTSVIRGESGEPNGIVTVSRTLPAAVRAAAS